MQVVKMKFATSKVVPILKLDTLLGMLNTSLAQNAELHTAVKDKIRADLQEDIPKDCLSALLFKLGAAFKEMIWATDWRNKVSEKLKEAVRNDPKMKKAICTINELNFKTFESAFQDFGRETHKLVTKGVLQIL
mmetsp:Transcript_4731/g.9166  ORF Transcript_4731/g.9166 Transcript_4731/m.9166 type:complete len:134 (-) Transcript_4731:137-538(-)